MSSRKENFIVILIVISLLMFIPSSIGKCISTSEIVRINTLPYGITALYTNDNLVLAGTKNSFFLSEDKGKHFFERDSGLSDLYITGVTYVDGKLFLGTQNAGLYISDDLGKYWKSQINKLDCPTVSSVSEINGTVYVTSFCSGFHFSTDYGESWKAKNNGLPTLETTTFLKTPSGRCFLGTKQFGLFYSDTLGETCKWNKLLSNYTITSLAYLKNTLFIGTTVGLFESDIENNTFKKVSFIEGSPYVSQIERIGNNILVAVENFGLFATMDGKEFVIIDTDELSAAHTMFYSKEKVLYLGNTDGNIYMLDLSKPYIYSKGEINLGKIQKGKDIQGVIKINSLGDGTLSGTIKSPYFIKFKNDTFSHSGELEFTIHTDFLSEGTYTEPIEFDSNGGNIKIYLSFTIVNASKIMIKLKIGSNVAYVNEKETFLDAPPFIVKSAGRTLVPIRFISETFNANVEWDAKERKVTIRKNPSEHHPPLFIELWIGKKDVRVNLKEQTIDVAPLIITPGRTMVPLRFIAETFGSNVQWKPNTREILITYIP